MPDSTTDSTVIIGVIPGKASGDLSGDLQLLGSITGDNILGVNSTNLICDDGANNQTLAHGGFAATDEVIALLQIDTSENKKRLGIYSADDGSITWAAWASYDGSFRLGTFFDVLVNSETMTLLGAAVYSSLLSDSNLTAEFKELDFTVFSSGEIITKSNLVGPSVSNWIGRQVSNMVGPRVSRRLFRP